MNKKLPFLPKTFFILLVCFSLCSFVLMGAESENWRSRDWSPATVSEFVAFASRACILKTLGTPDQQQGLTWIYTGVSVNNSEGAKLPHNLIITFESESSDSKVSSISLEAMDK
jgi:hypothetical protein